MTASLTIGEVLVKPVELGDSYLEMRYRTLLREPIVTIVPFDAAAGVIFAHIRQDRRIKRADAIHLASAASAGCDLFITNDERLSQVVVPGIQFITSMDRAPL
jgi:predicted nucleic acid-binding protein